MVELLENPLKIVEKRTRELMNVDAVTFGFTPGRETTDALFVIRNMSEK